MCWWFAVELSGPDLVWNRADRLSVPGESLPLILVSTVTACVEGPGAKNQQFLASFLYAVSKSGMDSSILLQGILRALLGLTEDWVSQEFSPPREVRLWRVTSAWLCFACGSALPVAAWAASCHRMQGLRSQPGWRRHWGCSGCLGVERGSGGALRLRFEGLQGATREAGLCWAFLVWLWLICSFHLLKARVTFASEDALALGPVNCFCFHS